MFGSNFRKKTTWIIWHYLYYVKSTRTHNTSSPDRTTPPATCTGRGWPPRPSGELLDVTWKETHVCRIFDSNADGYITKKQTGIKCCLESHHLTSQVTPSVESPVPGAGLPFWESASPIEANLHLRGRCPLLANLRGQVMPLQSYLKLSLNLWLNFTGLFFSPFNSRSGYTSWGQASLVQFSPV